MMSRSPLLFRCLFTLLAASLLPATAAAQEIEPEAGVAPQVEENPTAPDPEEDAEPNRPGSIVISGDLGDAPDGEEATGWTVELFGYVRTQYTAIQDDPELEQFGRNDGFSIADARLGLLGYLDNGVGFELEIDAGVARPSDEPNTAIGEVVTRLKDGYLFYQPHRLFRVSAGQFKAPFDIEDLISTANILFVERSVGSRGVQNIEGFNREGLSEGRQVGLRFDSQPYYLSGEAEEGPGFSYAFAVTNGQSANRPLNDNDDAAYFGRLNLHWADLVRVGGAAFYNDRTIGEEQPDLIGEERTGWTADVTVTAYGLTLLANIIEVDIEPAAEIQDEQARTSRAYQAQIAYEEPFFGLQPAYRFAYFDPAADIDEQSPRFEALTYHTVGLNYNARSYPIRLMLNYTVTGEEEREIDNDRFDALVQVRW